LPEEPANQEPVNQEPVRTPEPARSERNRRRPGRLRRWLLRPFIWGLLLLLGLLLGALGFVHSRFAHRNLAILLRASLADSLGRPVHLGAVDYRLVPLEFEVQDLVIPGPTAGALPVLQVPRARLQLSWRQLRRNIVDLEQVDLVRPVFYLQLNRDGTNNLPHLATRRSGQSSFQFHIGHLRIEHGVFQLNERHSELDLDAQGISALAEGADRQRLGAVISVQRIAARLPNARRYALALTARGTIDLAAGRVEIARARLVWPELAGVVTGTINWRGANRIELGLEAQGDARWLNQVGYMAEPIAGAVDLRARFTLHDGTWGYGGSIASPRVAVLHRVFQQLEARFAGDARRLDVDVRRARHAEGQIAGKVVVETAAPPGPRGGRPVVLDLGLTGLAVQPLLADQFPAQFAPPREPLVELAGRATGRLRYRFISAEPLAGSGRLDLHVAGSRFDFQRAAGAAASAGSDGGGGEGLAIAGDLPLVLSRGVVAAERIQLAANAQSVVVDAFRYDMLRGDGRLGFHLTTQDTGALLPMLAPSERGSHGGVGPGAYPVWLPSAGRGTVSGAVNIERAGYRAEIAPDLTGVQSYFGAADRVRGSLVLLPQAVENLRLEATSGGGALMATGRVQLPAAGRHAAPARFALAVDAAQWPAPPIVRFLFAPAAPPAAIGGEVSGRLDLAGDPDHLTGRADAGIENLVWDGVRIGHAKGLVGFDNSRVTVEGGLVESTAGKVLVRGSWERQSGGLDFTVDAPDLSLAAEPIAGFLRPGVAGRLTLMAALGGTALHPQATASLRASGLTVDGHALTPPSGGRAAGETQVLLTWDGETVHASGGLPGLLIVEGGGRLDRNGAAVDFTVASSDLGTLATLASPKPLPRFTGAFTGDLSVRAELAPRTVSAELRLADLRAEYQGKRLANREPVVLALRSGRLEVRSFYLREAGADNELVVSGSVDLTRHPMPLDLRFQSTIAASWINLVVPNLEVTGTVNALASVRGTLADPVLTGEGELRGARFIVPGLGSAVDDVEGVFLLYSDRLVLDGLRARFGGGTVRATGQVALPGSGRGVTYRLDLSAQGVSLRYPACCISRGDAQVSLTSTAQGRQIQGAVNLDRVLYFENFELDALQLILRGLRRERLQVAETGGVLSSTQINLVIHGPDVLRVNNNVADLRGSVELSVVGNLARPVVFGSVQLEPGGTLVYADNRFQLERGSLTFANPNRIDPLLDLVLKTQVQSFDITLDLSGPLDRLNAKFASSAQLGDMDILSLLAGGQRVEGEVLPPTAPPSETSASQNVATGFLAGQAATALTSRVGKLFGLDRFRIDPLSGETGQSVGGVAFTVGKRLSKRLYVTYSSDPSSSVPQVWQVEYLAGRQVKLLLTNSGRGDYALDVQWERRF
jgi:hypothetical protein